MDGVFWGATAFNGDVSAWDVSAVRNMSSMFRGASAFNGDVSAWNVSAVRDMSLMFSGATAFNGNLSAWDVSAVQRIGGMFRSATAFNGDVSAWNVSASARPRWARTARCTWEPAAVGDPRLLSDAAMQRFVVDGFLVLTLDDFDASFRRKIYDNAHSIFERSGRAGGGVGPHALANSNASLLRSPPHLPLTLRPLFVPVPAIVPSALVQRGDLLYTPGQRLQIRSGGEDVERVVM